MKPTIGMGYRGMFIREEDGYFLIQGLRGNPFYIKPVFDTVLHVMTEQKVYVPSELIPCVDTFLKRNYS